MWCFDNSWESRDNTPQGASKRIKYLVKKGRTPNDWGNKGSKISRDNSLD